MSEIGSAASAAAVAVGVGAVWTSVRARWRRREPSGSGVELWVLSAVVTLALFGLAASLLAVFGIFDRIALALCGGTLAAVLWPWERARPNPPRPAKTRITEVVAVLLLCASALALRWPAADYPLAGRDQGTYTLRAESLLRSGELGLADPVLANATADAEPRDRSGPDDLLGLYPRRPEAWRRGRYEGAYRPGWYLADRDRGHIVPQFLHLHPALMAAFGSVAGVHAMTGVVLIEAMLLVACIFCLARRLFGSVLLGVLAGGLIVLNPLAIWVQRTALTETVTGLFFWAAVLAIVRTRDHDPQDLDAAALLLGSLAWVRGNAWLAAPIVMAVLWLLPGRSPARRRPVALYLALTAAGVLAHASTSFPYLVDEFRRQLGSALLPAPETLALAALGGVVAWLTIDNWRFHAKTDRPRLAWLRRNLPAALVGATVLAIIVHLWLRAAAPEAPFSRLDPAYVLLGGPMLGLALVSLPRLATSVHLTRARDVWLAAAAATIVVTITLYAQRNLPQAGLYYYGRYLAPEILPACALLATATVHRVLGSRTRPRMQIAGGLGALLLGSTALPLVLDPVTRLREFAGAERLVDRLAFAVPPDAIVIAGGEGWHHGHTFNQVGGALAVRYARTVLPYRNRESFYSTAHELLIGRPEATQRPPPPLYLLLGEATHHYRRDDDSAPLAAIDDLLPPPFIAREVTLLELFTDRLTPVTGEIPTKVTRDQLRMALFKIEVDPTLAGEQRFSFRGGRQPEGLDVSGDFDLTEAGLCFRKSSVVAIRVARGIHLGPGSVVLVATPGTPEVNPKLKVRVDGPARRSTAVGIAPRPADTLGPFPVGEPAARIRIRGFGRRRDAPCPFGGIAEVRLLDVDRPALPGSQAKAITIAPRKNLGHPVEPTLWVGGRGLSRYRPGLDPPPEIQARSIVVTGKTTVQFAPEPVPGGGTSPVDVIVTLTGTRLSPSARLVLSADDRDVATFEPPRERSETWQNAEPVRWEPSAPVVRWGVRLVNAQQGDRVQIRDIGLFSRGPVIASRIAGE